MHFLGMETNSVCKQSKMCAGRFPYVLCISLEPLTLKPLC